MDGKVGIGALSLQKSKTDAFCKLSFAGFLVFFYFFS
jgi:hypothetical protein